MSMHPTTRHAALLEAALDAIITMDGAGRVVDFNGAAERTFGYDREEARGRVLSELIVPLELRGRHEAALSRHLRTGESSILGKRLELTACRRDGSVIPVELTVSRADIDGAPLFVGYVRDLSDAREKQAALDEAQARFRQLVEQVPTVTYICDAGEPLAVRYISPQIEAWTGYAPEEWTADRDFYLGVVHPDDRERVLAELGRCTRAEVEVDVEYRLVASDGSVLQIWDKETLIRDAHGTVLSSQGVLIDVTELRSTKAALEMSERRLRTVVDSAPVVLFALDADGTITLSEGRGLDALGLDPGEAVGRTMRDLYGKVPAMQFDAAYKRAMAGETVTDVVQVKDVVFEVVLSPGVGEHAVTGLATNVTARHRSERQLEHAVYHDALTGLPNRPALERRLGVAVEQARADGCSLAVLNLDIDGFKDVNDSLGHQAGDELIRVVAERLQARVGDAYPLHRHVGDEFVLLLDGVPGDGRALAEAVASELLDALRAPFRVGGADLTLGASLGISLFPADAGDAVDLLKHADIAMYQAKRTSRGGHALYDAAVDDAKRRLDLSNRLRAALARRELELHYQPVFDLATGLPIAVEALIRWNDPERGMVSPAEFIPLAEETGLIEPVGKWVLGEVCRQARVWRDLGIVVKIAYNASPQELTKPGFARRLGERMAAHGIRPGTLTVEIIESALSDPAAVAPVLERVAALGVQIAIDDFGAGFSSLTRLRDLTVHTLKLDRTFLHGVPDDERAVGFITAVLALASHLGLQVVAEGIETEEQLEFLRGECCRFGQGYHLARPMPAAQVTELLRAAAAR
jgi:diguanylate cyclase (GGDEF)-like protein/PAS domain S-box-containing protein